MFSLLRPLYKEEIFPPIEQMIEQDLREMKEEMKKRMKAQESVKIEPEGATGYESVDTKLESELSDQSQDSLENWLYYHRYSTYPSAEEKLVLAKMANISVSKLSRWLTNARKRLNPHMIRRNGHNPDKFVKRRDTHSKDEPDETTSVNKASNSRNFPTNAGSSGAMSSSEQVDEIPWITASAEGREIDIQSTEADSDGQNEYLQGEILYFTTPPEEPFTFFTAE